MDEKRREDRVNISFPVECNIMPKRNYFYTVSKDLSLGGAKIFSDDFIPQGNLIKLNINLIDEVVGLKAKIAWCSKESMLKRYSAGVEFIEIDKGNKKILSDFLNKIFQS